MSGVLIIVASKIRQMVWGRELPLPLCPQRVAAYRDKPDGRIFDFNRQVISFGTVLFALWPLVPVPRLPIQVDESNIIRLESLHQSESVLYQLGCIQELVAGGNPLPAIEEVFVDVIQAVPGNYCGPGQNQTCNPVPKNKETPLGTDLVQTASQKWRVGGPALPGYGIVIQSNTLKRFRDHGAHDNIVTPSN
jgi:hypothetical protein